MSLTPGTRLDLFALGGGPVNGHPTAFVCDLPECMNPRDFGVPQGQWKPEGRGMALVDTHPELRLVTRRHGPRDLARSFLFHIVPMPGIR